MYTITYDAGRAVLSARVEGFWDEATVARFAGDFAGRMAQLRAQGVVFGVLGDGSGFAVQSRAVAEGLMRLVNAADTANRAPTAIVAKTALGKMQAERAMNAPHLRVFVAEAEALAWLDRAIAEKRG